MTHMARFWPPTTNLSLVKAAAAVLTSSPPLPTTLHIYMRKKDREKVRRKKTLILTLIILTKLVFIWRFFLLTYGAENALKNRQFKHFFCAETSENQYHRNKKTNRVIVEILLYYR